MFFKVLSKDRNTKARVCEVQTDHGTFQTPIFMPVGTQGTVKAIEQRELEEIGAKIILSNTYHLYLRPGLEVLKQSGGLHKFMSWKKPLLTDSGGFQVFSLSSLRRITEEGVEFRSHHDGSLHFFTPEKVIEIQRVIGSDIIMVLDECIENRSDLNSASANLEFRRNAEEASNRTSRWAKRSKEEFVRGKSDYNHHQFLFGIIQGSVFEELRRKSAEDLIEIGFDGYAIGGLAVGEENNLMYDIVDYTIGILPENKPRYLMGVGTPVDLLNAIERGVDMFDCVIPTRNARNGMMFTSKGKLKLRNLENKFNFNTPDDQLDSYTARNFSIAYLRHLFMCDEILAYQLATIHNLRFYIKLIDDCRKAIREGTFDTFKEEFINTYSEFN